MPLTLFRGWSMQSCLRNLWTINGTAIDDSFSLPDCSSCSYKGAFSLVGENINTTLFIITSSINQSFILTRYVKELKNSFKIETCINKIYNNYSYIIPFNFEKKLNKYIHIKKDIKYKKLKPTKKPHTKNVTKKIITLALKTVKSYNRAL